jgi:hypothetical protein
MADPTIDLYDGRQTIVASNNDWGGGAKLARAFGHVGAFKLPADSKDAAVVVTLKPGSYSAHVTGRGRAAGVVLVEVYEVP